MTQSVELLLDDDLERAVRAQWERLAAAGLPSLAGHRSPTNRPHVTVSAAEAFGERHELALAGLPARLPIPVRLEGALLFEQPRGYVLVRPVVMSAALLAFHAAVDQALDGTVRPDFVRPDRWVPHVTLAHGLDAQQVGAALALGRPASEAGRAVAIRRYDSVGKLVRPVG